MPKAGPDKLTLAIEMSNPSMWPDPLVSGEVAIGLLGPGGARVLGAEPITQRAPRDDALAPAIDRLLCNAGVTPSRLDRIAVSGGPGGFTSVRIAVTTAKVIAEAVGAEVVVIPTGEVVARTIRKGGGFPGAVAVLLAGKRDSAWCAVYGPCDWNDGPWPRATVAGVTSADLFEGAIEPGCVTAMFADAHTPAPFLDWAQRAGVPVAHPLLGAEAVLVASRFHDAVDPAQALPIYPREPEAVTRWRHRLGAD